MLTTVLQTIGNTPMLRLDLSRDLPGTVWLKLENRNPGGSIKDRVAFYLIERALENGELEPDGVLVEATSGNMGIGMALVSAVRGLRCVLAMPESMSLERRNLLKVLGAELKLTPADKGMARPCRRRTASPRPRAAIFSASSPIPRPWRPITRAPGRKSTRTAWARWTCWWPVWARARPSPARAVF